MNPLPVLFRGPATPPVATPYDQQEISAAFTAARLLGQRHGLEMLTLLRLRTRQVQRDIVRADLSPVSCRFIDKTQPAPASPL